jgi:hypothetical protein
MKQLTNMIIFAGGLFIAAVKGQDARSRWISKMKNRNENRKSKMENTSEEVPLDDFEIASFHKN